MTMEERLNALSVAKKTDEDVATAPPPRADSYAILLSQGLQSNDRDVLNVSLLLFVRLRSCTVFENV